MGGDSCQCSLKSNHSSYKYELIAQMLKQSNWILLLIISQLYQHLKNMQLDSPNITRVRSYSFSMEKLNDFYTYSNDSVIVFVSDKKKDFQ